MGGILAEREDWGDRVFPFHAAMPVVECPNDAGIVALRRFQGMNATVFYAWQSDRPRKITRNLIANAAEAVCQRITEDNSNPWNLTLDSDTRGVVGMCDIPNTILEKIKTCSMFLADLTFVGTTADGEQQMPNANVLFELGFAAGALGFEPLIGVMNEAYGKKEEQVFDIKRRASLHYSLQEGATPSTITKEQESLSRRLEEVFRATLEQVVAPRIGEAAVSREQKFKNLQSDFAARVKQGKFNDYAMLPATLLTIQTSLDDPLEYDDLFNRVAATGKNLRPSEDAMNWADGCQSVELGINGLLLHAYGGIYESFKAKYPYTPHARAARHEENEPDEPELWSVTHLGSRSHYHSSTGAAPRLLPASDLQMKLVSHAFDQCRLLAGLQLPFPWLVGVSLVGANGFRLLSGSQESPKTIDADDLHFGPCTIMSSEQMGDRVAIAHFLRDLLNRLCRRVGFDRSECFNLDGTWNQQFLG